MSSYTLRVSINPWRCGKIHSLLQLVQALQLKVDLDLAVGSQLERFGGVLPVTDVRALDTDALEDGPEGVGSESGVGETDSDEGAAGTEVVDGLLECRFVRGDNDTGMGSETLRSVLDLLDEVFGGRKVDKGMSAERETEVTLGLARVDGNDAQTHGGGVLHGQVAKTTTGTGDGDVVADVDVGVLERFVGGDASTEDGGGAGRVERLGNGSDVVDEGTDVLGEGAVGGVAGELRL